jgi:hypothetical protein
MRTLCKFCDQERQLIRAHIIPESLYPFEEGQKRAPLIYLVPKPHYQSSRSPTGIYDLNLVCEQCERRFALWDDAAHRVLGRESKWDLGLGTVADPAALVTQGSYERLKLFFISLLWRAHSTTQPMFQHVRLGPWAERAKQHILEKNPGTADEFAVFLERYIDLKFCGAILDPRPQTLLGCRFYRFHLGQCIAHIKVDSRKVRAPFEELILKPGGRTVAIARRLEGAPELAVMRKIAREIHARRVAKSKGALI